MITNNLQRHPFLRLLMPLVGGIVYGDKYPYILSVGWWIAVILLLIGTYILGRKYYVLCKLYGAVVFLACFVLGWTLVSVQLKQAEYIFHLPDYSYDKAGNQEKQYFISRCFAGRSAERYIFI